MNEFIALFLVVVAAAAPILVYVILPGMKVNEFFDVAKKTFPEGYLKKSLLDSNEYIVPFHSFHFKLWVEYGGKYTPRITCFSIAIPKVESYSIQIEAYRFFWENLEDLDRRGLLDRTTCRTKDPLLAALKYNREFLQAIYQLVLLGDVRIRFSRNVFQVQILQLFSERKDTLQFTSGCLRVFQCLGQVVAPMLPAWQTPGVACDFWAPDFVPNIFEDERRLRFTPGEEEAEMSVAQAVQRRKLSDNDIEPEKFVLCSVCFEKFDGEIIRCQSCGAGHHRRCAGGNCGECHAPMLVDSGPVPEDAFSADIPAFEGHSARFAFEPPAPRSAFPAVGPTPMLLDGEQDRSRPEALLSERPALPLAQPARLPTSGSGAALDAPGRASWTAAPTLPPPSSRQALAPSLPGAPEGIDEMRLPESFAALDRSGSPDAAAPAFSTAERFGAGEKFDAEAPFAPLDDSLPSSFNDAPSTGKAPREESFEEMLARLRRSV